MVETPREIIDKHLRDPDILKHSNDEIRKIKSEMLKASFKHHYDNCEDYRKYCEVKHVDPSMINGIEDALKIPLLDSWETLRKRSFISVPEDQITHNFTSTGTTGKTVLKIPRDDISFQWQGIVLMKLLSDVLDMKPGHTLLMVPDMPNMVFSQIFKEHMPKHGHNFMIGLKFEMKDGKPNIFPDTEIISEFFKSNAEIKNLVGFPFTIAQLKDFVDKTGMKASLGKDSIIMTAGGWKAKTESSYAKMSRPELETVMSETFDISKDNIRDVYGASELAGACFECKFTKDGETVKRKHVAPWMHLLIFDPDTLEVAKPGEAGRAAFYDPAAYSHPGFILTDDILKIISEDGCECGRPGQVIEYVDRLQMTGQRGCSFTVQNKLFSEEFLKVKPTEAKPAAASGGGTDGILEFMKSSYGDVDSDFIRGNVSEMVTAMEEIVNVIKLISADKSLADSMDIVTLGKLMCFQSGEPVELTLDEIMQASKGIEPERIERILVQLADAGLFIKGEKDGKVTFKVTEKGDELGEALFPMMIWAMKWATED